MSRRSKTGDIKMTDVPKFVKTFCRILTYRTSIHRFFENRDNMYKMLHPDDSLSEVSPAFKRLIGQEIVGLIILI